MTFALAPSRFAERAGSRADAWPRALAVVAITMMQGVVLLPRGPDPGRP